MPFGLKNAGATYQKAMHEIFHDMIHDTMEDYVDVIVVVKSKQESDHTGILRKVFERRRKYLLKMNPKKCAFWVTAGKFLGFLVHNRGLEVDPNKAKAIENMPPSTTQKQLKSVFGKVSFTKIYTDLRENYEIIGRDIKD